MLGKDEESVSDQMNDVLAQVSNRNSSYSLLIFLVGKKMCQLKLILHCKHQLMLTWTLFICSFYFNKIIFKPLHLHICVCGGGGGGLGMVSFVDF